MKTETSTCKCGTANPAQAETAEGEANADASEIVDEKVRLLIAAGAAMAANCEPCLNKIIPGLRAAGVNERDIRAAVGVGQYVKDQPAALMKQLADELTGSHLAQAPASGCCPLGEETPSKA